MIYKTYLKTEIGILEITGTDDGILSLCFLEQSAEIEAEIPECLKECVRQLEQYFNGDRKEFDLTLIPEGTIFQNKVWKALEKIPFGRTASYGEIARAVGNIKASRAVGGANNKNKIAIIIPCHRIIGGNGKLTGYAGGLWRKEWLLKHEKGWNL